MRSLEQIDRDLAKASDRVRALRKERQQFLWIWRNRIIDAFDNGMPMIDLVAKTDLSYDSIRAILFRAGRTLGNRGSIRRQIAEAVRPAGQTWAAP